MTLLLISMYPVLAVSNLSSSKRLSSQDIRGCMGDCLASAFWNHHYSVLETFHSDPALYRLNGKQPVRVLTTHKQ